MANPRQLLLVKQLFDDGSVLATRDDELSLVKALLLLDLAVETMLNIVILELSGSEQEERRGREDLGWAELWRQASAALKPKGARLPGHKAIRALREVRNLTQHNGSIPTASEVRRYPQAVSDVLSAAFKDGFGLSFQTFRIWDLLRNSHLQRLLGEAEGALDRSHPGHTITVCIGIHALMLENLRRETNLGNFSMADHKLQALEWAAPWNDPATQRVVRELKEAIEQVYRETSRRIGHLEDELVSIAVGLPIVDVRHFAKIRAGIDVWIRDPTWQVTKYRDRPDERADAAFMLDYLSHMLFLTQEGYPGLIERIPVLGSPPRIGPAAQAPTTD